MSLCSAALIGLLLIQNSDAAPAPIPFPRGDGFVYPGQAGAQGIEAYDRIYRRWMGTLPAPAPESPLAREFGWMAGRWSAEARDFEADGSGMIEVGTGHAEARLVGDGRWLRLEVQAGRLQWIFHFGFDRVRRHYVLQQIWAPGLGPVGQSVSSGWHGDRIRFGPYAVDVRGLSLRGRLTLLRQGRDGFRIVNEAVLRNGRAVAVDDLVFTRAGD